MSVDEAVHTIGLDRFDVEGTKQKLRDLAVHEMDGETVIALEPKTILQVLGGITAAWLAWKVLKKLVPGVWKLRWPLAITGIAAGVYTWLKKR